VHCRQPIAGRPGVAIVARTDGASMATAAAFGLETAPGRRSGR